MAPDPRAWLAVFQAVSGKGGTGQDAPRHPRIAHPCAWAVDPRPAPPRSCGLAVVVGTMPGLFDVATAVAHLGQGLARAHCEGLPSCGANDRACAIDWGVPVNTLTR